MANSKEGAKKANNTTVRNQNKNTFNNIKYYKHSKVFSGKNKENYLQKYYKDNQEMQNLYKNKNLAVNINNLKEENIGNSYNVMPGMVPILRNKYVGPNGKRFGVPPYIRPSQTLSTAPAPTPALTRNQMRAARLAALNKKGGKTRRNRKN